MFRSTLGFGIRPRAGQARARRRHAFRPTSEAVEGRMLLSTLSAISWQSGGLEHEAVFAIGVDNAVYMNRDLSGFVSLGGYLKQISAGLDASGNPEIYGIGSDNAVYVNHLGGQGWIDLGGHWTSISASSDNMVYAIGENHSVYLSSQQGQIWQELFSSSTGLGSDVTAISAGRDGNGLPMVCALLPNGQTIFDSIATSGISLWFNLGGDSTAISATGDTTVFAVTPNGSVSMDQLTTPNGWVNLGGTVKAISAGMDGATGAPEVYGIGTDNATWVDENQRGWASQGGYVTEISATANSGDYARGGLVTQVFVNHQGVGYGYIGSTPMANPQSPTNYSPAPAGTPLFNNGTPSYLDVAMGSIGDCWLMASLAEAAARDSQLIENMFTYNGATVDNGSTVGLYTVRFYSTNGIAFGIQVDTEFPSGGTYADHIQNPLGTSALWAALAEKAYAEANTLGLVSSDDPNQDSYTALISGDPTMSLQAITGIPASQFNVSGLDPAYLGTLWNAGMLIVLNTATPASTAIVNDHCYAMVGYNASSSMPFELYNPWGTTASGWAPSGHFGYPVYGLFLASSGFISQNFSTVSFGLAAALGPDETGPVLGANPNGAAIVVTKPVDLSLPRPRKMAVVATRAHDGITAYHKRLDVVAATGGDVLGALDPVTPGTSWRSRRLSAIRFGLARE
jgi:hypothetical protein